MCGIAGILDRRGVGAECLDGVERMSSAMVHRGPDGRGDYRDERLLMTMRRLSIIDLEGGWQPLYNDDRSLVLMANGEIYNFLELRADLQSRGHELLTGSDCEVILHLYEECGTECVHQLRGMFAFALWDKKQHRLVLARDRMGEKPLYLYRQDNRLVFASELRALLRSGLVPFELDPVSVDQYFHFQYVPEPRTPLQGVEKLDAGCLLIADVESWRIQERRYWDLALSPPIDGNPPTRIRRELERVSELVIRSDVPVGIALSGGLDSSAIAVLAARRYPGTMHAFTVGYPGGVQTDERSDARSLAESLGMPFHEVVIETGEMVSFFPDLVHLRDDPIADIAGQGYFAVMKLAREHGVPVVLQGQGGDELFWGYPWVRQGARESRRKDFALRHQALGTLRYLCPRRPSGIQGWQIKRWIREGGGMGEGLGRLRRDRGSPPGQLLFYDLVPDFLQARAERSHLFTPGFLDAVGSHRSEDVFTWPRPWPDTDVLLTQLICGTYLRENGVAQGDRLSMASSVELRLPLLDFRLVETVAGLRKRRSDSGLPSKNWLKEAVRGLVPDDVIARPKRGFTPPVREWHVALFKAYGDRLRGGELVQAGVLRHESAEKLSTGPFPDGASTPTSFKALVLDFWIESLRSETRRTNESALPRGPGS